MIVIDHFIKSFSEYFVKHSNSHPWEITNNLSNDLFSSITQLDAQFYINDGVAIHKSAKIEKGAILKAPIIVSEDCFIGANAYLRGGVYLGKNTSIGPSCEIKSSILCNNTQIAHLNFIGDSIIGSNVNFEAGSITANYFNERTEKTVYVLLDSIIINTNRTKFGSLVGDHCKIGANAVLSPGTILSPNTIVKRLELIDQLKNQ